MDNMKHSKFAIGLLVLLAGCSSVSRRTVPDGNVAGTVTAGPTCPVEIPGDPTCLPAPVVGSVEFLVGDEVATSALIDGDGHFASTLEVGHYTLHVNVGESPFPSCPDEQVTVIDSKRVIINVDCDTGIRGPGS